MFGHQGKPGGMNIMGGGGGHSGAFGSRGMGMGSFGGNMTRLDNRLNRRFGTPMPQPVADWRTSMGTWAGQRPQRPAGGFGGDPTARQGYRDQMQTWMGTRPAFPTLPPAVPPAPTPPGVHPGPQPQGHAWGRRFQDRFGESPGHMREAFQNFKNSGLSAGNANWPQQGPFPGQGSPWGEHGMGHDDDGQNGNSMHTGNALNQLRLWMQNQQNTPGRPDWLSSLLARFNQ